MSGGLVRPLLVGSSLSLGFAALLYGLREWSGDAMHGVAFVIALGIALGMRRASPRRDGGMRMFAALFVYLALALSHLPVIATVIGAELAGDDGHGRTDAAAKPIAYAIALPVSCVAPVVMAAEEPRASGPPLVEALLACVVGAWVVGRRQGP